MPKSESFHRFSVLDRIEHWLLTASFALLAVTGLIQQHIDSGLAHTLIALLGGIETVRLIHHVAAVVLMLETVYHIGVLSYKFFVLRARPTILPGKEDALNVWQALRYGLGLSSERPREGRYTFAEKMEYWAVVWGTVVMGITGFMLWNPIATTRLLPGAFVPAAKAAHGKEALLAVLAILLWHLYHVHIRHFNKSMFTGKLSEKEMEDEHPLELAAIRAQAIEPRPDATTIRRRRRAFFPIYGSVAVALMAGIWFFVAYESTAIATLPPAEDVAVYVPLTPTPIPTLPPTPTPLAGTATPMPATAESWEGGIGQLFQTRCGACHSSTNKLGGADLSTYQAALAGGLSGPGIVPSETSTSLVVSRQTSGKHPGMFTPEELALVIHWIELGAPEK